MAPHRRITAVVVPMHHHLQITRRQVAPVVMATILHQLPLLSLTVAVRNDERSQPLEQ